MAKRIYFDKIKNWIIGTSLIGLPAVFGLFFYLSMIGSITVNDFYYDEICVGTYEQPCYAYINFTVNEDIFIYPNDNWTNSVFVTNPQAKEIKIYRNWGTGWRYIPLDKKCTGTWCGGTGAYEPAYSYAFRDGKTYLIRFEIIKNNPEEDLNFKVLI